MPDPNQLDYSNETVEIYKLAVTSPVIEDKTFSNCVIVGPAFLVIQNEVSLVGCTFQSHDVFIRTGALGVDMVFGAIGLNRVSFAGCRFEKVNFLMPDEAYELLVDGFSEG